MTYALLGEWDEGRVILECHAYGDSDPSAAHHGMFQSAADRDMPSLRARAATRLEQLLEHALAPPAD